MNGEEDVINTDQIMLPSNEPQNWIWKRYVQCLRKCAWFGDQYRNAIKKEKGLNYDFSFLYRTFIHRSWIL